MDKTFTFFKAWVRFLEKVKGLSLVHVLQPERHVREWSGYEAHPIPTLVLSIDMHLRIKTAIDKHVDIHPLEALIISPGVMHQHIPPRHKGMCYTQGFMETYADFRLVDTEEEYLGSANRELLWGRFHAIMDEVDAQQRCDQMIDYFEVMSNDGMLEEIERHPAAGAMHEFIRQNAKHDIGIDDIIRVSGLGEAHAFAVYKKCYGLSPMQHLLKRRVNFAQALLRTGVPMADVVIECGFQSSRQMNRAFHRFVGMAPRAWLKSLDEA